MLKSSGSWILHTNSINVIFFDGLCCLVLRRTSYLDAFSTYPSVRGYSACFITTDTLEAPEYRSSRTRYSFHSDNYAPCRYYTNCLAYFINAYDFKNFVLEASKFYFDVLHCVDYTFILKTLRFLGDQRVNDIIHTILVLAYKVSTGSITFVTTSLGVAIILTVNQIKDSPI